MLQLIRDIAVFVGSMFCFSVVLMVLHLLLKIIKETPDDKSATELKATIVKPLGRCIMLCAMGLLVLFVGFILALFV